MPQHKRGFMFWTGSYHGDLMFFLYWKVHFVFLFLWNSFLEAAEMDCSVGTCNSLPVEICCRLIFLSPWWFMIPSDRQFLWPWGLRAFCLQVWMISALLTKCFLRLSAGHSPFMRTDEIPKFLIWKFTRKKDYLIKDNKILLHPNSKKGIHNDSQNNFRGSLTSKSKIGLLHNIFLQTVSLSFTI